jgi:hypothetical protein
MQLMTLLLAVLFAIAGFQAPQTATGVLEGVVTRAGSVQPVEGVRIFIWGDKGAEFQTRTDTNGNYRFSALPPGVFSIEAQSAGYLPLPNSLASQAIKVTIGEQQRMRHDLTLTPMATISGQILDENREPIPGAAVAILQLGHDHKGRAQWARTTSTMTDAKGEYRVEGLAPDEYFVRAARVPPPTSVAPLNFGTLAWTYFPGTVDARSAAPLRLRGGDEQNAVFSMVHARTYSVSGSIRHSDSANVPSASLLAIPQDSKIPLDGFGSAGVAVGGNFEVKGLLPGRYDIFAVSRPDRVARASVVIHDEDIKDLRLVLDPGVHVKGRIKVMDDSGGKPVTLQFRPSGRPGFGLIELTTESTKVPIELVLRRKEDLISGINNPRAVEVANDTFTISDVAAGAYDVSLSLLGSDKLYLADVRDGARTVFDEGLEVFGQPVEFLEVVVGLDGGAVEGTIAGGTKSHVFVVLAPHPSRRRNTALYRTLAVTDATKPFRFSALAPGLYSLFAFELPAAGRSVPFANPEFLSLYETQAVPVTVAKGAAAGPIQVPLIKR